MCGWLGDMENSNLWYTRRDGEVHGPYPTGLVTRYILLGRISESDELSPDGEVWKPLEAFPDLIPEVMRNVVTEEDRQRLLLARLREDERTPREDLPDRAGQSSYGGPERRDPEPETVVRHRQLKIRLSEEDSENRESYRLPVLVAVAFVIALTAIFAFYTPPPPTGIAQCDAPAAPGVDWSNCALEGIQAPGADLTEAHIRNADLSGANLQRAVLAQADLAYANLSLADLAGADFSGANLKGAGLRNAELSGVRFREADLSFADLSGATLDGADLTGAKLDNAIWLQRQVCGPGSVGVCLVPLTEGTQ